MSPFNRPLESLRLYTLWVGLCGIGGLLTMSGCAPWGHLGALSERLFEPLGDRNLSAFEQRLAHLKRAGAEGDAMIIATQWIHLLTCHPLPPLPPPQAPLWNALHASLYLEALRDERHSGHWSEVFAQSGLKLTPPQVDMSLWARWPKSEEGWPDERPIFLKVNACRAIDQLDQRQLVWSGFPAPKSMMKALNVSERSPSSLDDAPSSGAIGPDQAEKRAEDSTSLHWPLNTFIQSLQRHLGDEGVLDTQRLFWLDRGLRSIGAIPVVDDPSVARLIRSWRWWLTYERAQVLTRRSTLSVGWPARSGASLGSLYLHHHACVLWASLFNDRAQLTEGRSISEATAKVALLSGLCLEGRGRLRAAIERWESIDEEAMEGEIISLTRYHRLRGLSQLGAWSRASAMGALLPSPRSPLYPPFAYALGEAMVNVGDHEALMALSTEIFRDHSWRRDPFFRGLFYLFVRGLTRYGFEERVIELLEDLGPRHETYERVFLFAQVALDEGQTQRAKDAAFWLLDHHENGRWWPRYFSILARVALLERSRDSFKRALRQVISVDEALFEALPRGRRGAFFEDQDRAMVELLRQILPQLAEWDDSERPRRRAWLNLILTEVQLLLRDRPETRARSALIELYRLGRQMLSKRDIRGYVERIGRPQTEALLLGLVRVNGVNLEPFEPRSVQARLISPWSLTLIPNGAFDPLRWGLSWSAPIERGSRPSSPTPSTWAQQGGL